MLWTFTRAGESPRAILCCVDLEARFDGKSLSIKLGISAGILGGEYIVTRRFKGDERLENAAYLSSGASNLVGTAVPAVTARRNYRRIPHERRAEGGRSTHLAAFPDGAPRSIAFVRA